MGFGDTEMNIRALRESKGDLNGAVAIVIKHPSSRPSTTKNSDPHVTPALLHSLQNMGFKDEKRNIEALKQAHGDVDRAVNILVKEAVTHGFFLPFSLLSTKKGQETNAKCHKQKLKCCFRFF